MGEAPNRQAVAILAAFSLARLLMMASLGLGPDKSYTLVVSRRLALSYFDHPPLHQWLAHFSALLFGETVFARLPFVALFALTGWLVYVLTREMFGAGAGLVALFALNVTPFFFASAGGWVVPDGPLLAALAAAALALAKLIFGAPPGRREAWMLWLAVGAGFGLAGLSKYSAALNALGLVAFFALSPRQRRWFAHPAPYAAMVLALALQAPTVIWNAENDWISLSFQAARGAPNGHIGFVDALAAALGQILYLTPWVFAGLVLGVIWAFRAARRGDERGLFLVALAAPPIALFTLTPIWGDRGLPHWAMPGWFFLYPLLGAALAGVPSPAPILSSSKEREGVSAREGFYAASNGRNRASRDLPSPQPSPASGNGRRLRRWAIGSAAFLAALVALVVAQADFGVAQRLLGRSFPDPTLESLSWRELEGAIGEGADFVALPSWWEAGRAGVALGPQTPIFVYSDNQRGFALLDDSARFVGRDGDLVVERGEIAAAEATLQCDFKSFGPPRLIALHRGGRGEIELAVIRAQSLTRPFAAPYWRRRP